MGSSENRQLKIAILSRGPRLYSTRRLKEAAKAAGHKAKVLNPLKFSIDVEHGAPDLHYKGKPLSNYDAVIPRIGASVTLFGTAVLRQFEQMGVYTVNTSASVSVSRDKLRSIQILSRHKVGFPKTAFVHALDQIEPTIEHMGGPPVVIKLLQGTQGIGVLLADSINVAQSIIEVLHSAANQNVLIQEFIAESKGRDVRALVVGSRVVAAMRRTAQGDEFRSNLHRGGTAEIVQLDPSYERAAVRAAQIMGLRVAGVDMLEGKDGPMVMEVNSSPGLEGIETSTGIDVAGSIIRLIEDEVLFPDIDLRQRLTLKSGYGVLEIPVEDGSPWVGRKLKETGIREKDGLVLTIQRGDISIPNPLGSRELLAGDILLCFGNTMTLKQFAPTPRKRRRKRTRPNAPAAADSKDEAAPSDVTPGDGT